MSHAFLTGGGRDESGLPHPPAPFARAVLATGRDDVVVLVHGDGGEEWERVLDGLGLQPELRDVAAGCAPVVGDAAGVFVAGGLTPAYQEALCPDPSWLAPDAVYGGFSAGAAIAAEVAIVGGWRADGVAVCAEEAGEDLDELELRPGLALLPALVEVHCAQWGTLGRLVEVVATGDGRPGWGLDEHTTLEVRDGAAVAVHGAGAAWLVEPVAGDDGAVTTRRMLAGPLNG